MQKMNYYYAIIHCNTGKTALHLYDEYNGLMLENTNVRLRMAIVPDGTEFTQEVKEVATHVPEGHEPTFFQNRLNRALGHTKVKLTWDATDPKRQQRLVEGFKRAGIDDENSDVEAEYYKDFIASESGSDKDENVNIEEYRKKLLSGL